MVFNSFFGNVQLIGDFGNGPTFELAEPEHFLSFLRQRLHAIPDRSHEIVVFHPLERCFFLRGQVGLVVEETLVPGKLIFNVGDHLVFNGDMQIMAEVVDLQRVSTLPETYEQIIHDLLRNFFGLQLRTGELMSGPPVAIEKRSKRIFVVVSDERNEFFVTMSVQALHVKGKGLSMLWNIFLKVNRIDVAGQGYFFLKCFRGGDRIFRHIDICGQKDERVT